MYPQIFLLRAARLVSQLCFWAAVGLIVASASSVLAQTNATTTPPVSVSQTDTCLNNLIQIYAAKEQWALENHKSTNDTSTTAELAAFLKDNKMPVCPGGGEYAIGRIGEPPSCSISGHNLAPTFLFTWKPDGAISSEPSTNPAPTFALRAKVSCLYHLRQISAAKAQWALVNSRSSTDTPRPEDITTYIRNEVFPKCPAGGTYTLGHVGEDPTCSIPGHGLPTR